MTEPLALDFEKRGGLLPAIVQDSQTKEILMLAWMNPEAWQHTLSSGHATFWSTSRHELWEKGLTSGDVLHVVEIRIDCDQDTILLIVKPQGSGACHTKNLQGKTRTSCFYRRLNTDSGQLLILEP